MNWKKKKTMRWAVTNRISHHHPLWMTARYSQIEAPHPPISIRVDRFSGNDLLAVTLWKPRPSTHPFRPPTMNRCCVHFLSMEEKTVELYWLDPTVWARWLTRRRTSSSRSKSGSAFTWNSKLPTSGFIFCLCRPADSIRSLRRVCQQRLHLALFSRSCFPFGRPEGALKATLSLMERVRPT